MSGYIFIQFLNVKSGESLRKFLKVWHKSPLHLKRRAVTHLAGTQASELDDKTMTSL